MKNAVILHGKPTRERYENPDIPKPHEANWFPWIRDRLAELGIQASVPALPRPYFPDYEVWREVFEAEQVDESTGLVGHSAGAEFLLRWLSASKRAVERVVLVAPYRDDKGKYGDFSKYTLDPGIAERVGRLTIIHSLDDDPQISERVRQLRDAFPTACYVELDDHGHFRIGHNMTGPEFPVLLHELVDEIA